MNSPIRQPIVILMADDDIDDQQLCKEAMEESRLINTLKCVNDGVELMEYLERKGEFSDPEKSPRPDLILLDLNMPRMDGRAALHEIKTHPRFRSIPVVILTTSKAEEDMLKGYELGAASYISKPVTFTGLVELMRSLGRYWLEIVQLPPHREE